MMNPILEQLDVINTDLVGRRTKIDGNGIHVDVEALYKVGIDSIEMYGYCDEYGDFLLCVEHEETSQLPFDDSPGRKDEDSETIKWIDGFEARRWAARYLSRDEYEQCFGKVTDIEKLIIGLDGNDLIWMLDCAIRIRDHEADTEKALTLLTKSIDMHTADIFPDIGSSDIYELAKRVWTLTAPIPTYVDADD